MDSFEKILLQNKAWSKEKIEEDPNFFKRMAEVQKPEFLWIGCSDSRVPANEITNTEPGEMFTHRNIANIILHTDLNILSVLYYAVDVLQVKHVIVCGHYGCGGVKASFENSPVGLIGKWLRTLKDIQYVRREELESLDEQQKIDRLVELNVEEQIFNLSKTLIIQNAWKKRKAPYLHGCIYNIANGQLKELVQMGPDSKIDPIYQYKI